MVIVVKLSMNLWDQVYVGDVTSVLDFVTGQQAGGERH